MRWLVLIAVLLSITATTAMADVSVELQSASVKFDGRQLTVDTGLVRRAWNWTGKGFATTSIRYDPTGREWVGGEGGEGGAGEESAVGCDWTPSDAAKLQGVTARPDNDGGFTSQHIEVVASIEYPSEKLAVQFVVWVYPGSPGIRTQLRYRALAGFSDKSFPDNPDRIEDFPVAVGKLTRHAVGYFTGLQHRDTDETKILQEQRSAGPLRPGEAYDWASALCAADDRGGLWMVKESHKCANQPGYDTGAFHCDASGVWIDGRGIKAQDILPDRYRAGWATWCIAYDGGTDQGELALKIFDRFRYPVDPSRDVYIMANPWGSDRNRDASPEKNILVEIASQKDLGIDVQQIDDGWQVKPGAKSYNTASWRPTPPRYPDGWGTVRKAAEQSGIILGLWGAAEKIPLADLIYNYDNGGFRYFKLDFSVLDSYDRLEALTSKVRQFIQYTGMKARVNWDVTEVYPRFGYFFGREYGNIYLENRKLAIPTNVVYIPHLVLRDAWQVAKYVNLNKFQIPIQNIDRVNPAASNARQYNHPYCVAIALMASPLFFQETQLYTPQARAQIRPLIAVYKQHRQEMFSGYIHPIGDEPNDKNWAGFQCHIPGSNAGYLTIFRELHNGQADKPMKLAYVAGRNLKLTDLMSKVESVVKVAADGTANFHIDTPAGYRFYRYEAE